MGKREGLRGAHGWGTVPARARDSDGPWLRGDQPRGAGHGPRPRSLPTGGAPAAQSNTRPRRERACPGPRHPSVPALGAHWHFVTILWAWPLEAPVFPVPCSPRAVALLWDLRGDPTRLPSTPVGALAALPAARRRRCQETSTSHDRPAEAVTAQPLGAASPP